MAYHHHHSLQMSWQPSLQKRRSSPPLGLRNLGNTCYLNSVLQCLTYTPPLANFCLNSQHSSSCDLAATKEKKSDCPFCILEKRIVRSLSIDIALDAPLRINNCLKLFAEHFKCGRQEDAHEFLRYVIDACHNTCLRLRKLQAAKKKLIGNGNGSINGNASNGVVGVGDGNNSHTSSTVVKEIFGGALQSQVKCSGCGMESNKVDEIMDISLDVLHSSSLKDAMQRFFQPEVLDGNNKYKCDNCKKLVSARKQMSILQAPNVLVIQLKRFEEIFGGKIDKPIAFEEVLVLSSYMCKASQDPLPEYKLFGTIVHSGFSPDSGHYYAYIKDALGRWYCCNDSYVSLSTLQEVLSEKVYILFFSRTKQRPSPAKTSVTANGSKSYESNGSDAPKIAGPHRIEKPLYMKQPSERHSVINNVITPKVEKVPSSPLKKLSLFESNGTGKLSTNGNIKIVHKRDSNERNGDLRDSAHMEQNEKNSLSTVGTNGVSESNSNNVVVSEKKRPVVLENGNGRNPVVPSRDQHLDNGTSGKTLGRSLEFKDAQNASMKRSPNSIGVKRKSPEDIPCILLDKDDRSRAIVESYKKVIAEETSSILRSSEWYPNVHEFMRSRKKFYLQSGYDASNDRDIKRLLIADARPTFNFQIPESLKENLVEKIRSFSQQRQSSFS